MTMTLMFSSPMLQHTGKTCQDVIRRAVPGACTKSEADPGMVVSDRQSRRRIRRRLRRSMDAVPPGWRAGRRARGMGQPDGLDGPRGGDHRYGASLRRNLRPRRRRTGRGDHAAVSRVDRRLDFRGAPGGARRGPGCSGQRSRAQESRPTARAFAMRSISPPTSLLFSMATTASAANRTTGAPPIISASPSSRSMASSCFMEGRSSCRALRGWIGNGAVNLSLRPKRVGTGFRCISRPARS